MRRHLWFLLLGFWVLAGGGPAAEIPADFHPNLGPADRENLYENRQPVVLRRAELPARVINHEHLPVVRSQGDENICAWFALAYYIRTYQEAREQGWVHPDASTHPERVIDVYSLSRFNNYLSVMYVFGAKTFDTYWSSTDSIPPPEVFAEMQRHRLEHYWSPAASTAEEQLTNVKQQLAGGDIVYSEIYASPNFDYYPNYGEGIDDNVFLAYAGPGNRGLHAITMIGYDDDMAYTDGGVPKSGALLAVNSWGPGWGVELPEMGTAGFIWISYDFFKSQMADTIILQEDRPSVDCRDYAIVDYVHENADELILSVNVGDSDIGPDEHRSLSLDQALGMRRVDGPIPVPIDRFTEIGALNFNLSFADMDLPIIYGAGQRVGVIRSFEVQLDDGASVWKCEDTMVPTIDFNPLASPPEFPDALQIMEAGLFEERYVDKRDGHPMFLGYGDYTLKAGDLDRDGDVDLVECYPTGGDTQYEIELRRNNGDGTFDLYDTNLPIGDIALVDAADFNRDGFLDVVLKVGTEFAIYHRDTVFGQFVDSGARFSGVEISLSARAVDWNHDGAMDIAITGRPDYYLPHPTETTWRFYWNDGSGSFTESSWRLPGTFQQWPHMEFADINRDGWEDLVVAMHTEADDYGIWIFGFAGEEVPLREIASISGMHYKDIEGLAVADVTGDGWVDIITTNSDGEHTLHTNSSGTSFTSSVWGFTGLDKFAFGDVDLDGLPDVAMAGEWNGEPHNGLYRNVDNTRQSYLCGPDIVVAVAGESADLTNADVALADFDDDGDLDFVVAGVFNPDSIDWWEHYSGLHYYENLTAQPERLNLPNQAPAAPEVALQSLDTGSGALAIEFLPPADDYTPADQLGYQYALGTMPGWGDLSTDAFAFGQPLMARPTASSGTAAIALHVPTDRASFVRLRAIDEGLAASEWSEPLLVMPPGVAHPFDINRDNLVDAADAVELRQLFYTTIPDDIGRGDLNGDGKVGDPDRVLLARDLTGHGIADPTLIDVLSVTPEDGGILVTDDFVVNVPAGAVSEYLEIEFYRGQEPMPMPGAIADSIVRMEGVPVTHTQPFQVAFPIGAYNPDSTVLMYGREGYVTSVWDDVMSWKILRPVSTQDGMLTFDLPSLEDPAREVGRGGYQISKVTRYIGLGEYVFQMESDHFLVQFDQSVETGDIVEMLDAVEWAWDQLRNIYKFDIGGIDGKINIQVLEGINYAGYYDRDDDYIGVNSHGLTQALPPGNFLTSTRTAVHETMHRFTAQYYKPASALTWNWKKDTEWPDEACAIWLECTYNLDSGEAARTLLDNNFMAPFERSFEGGVKADPDQYGYGLATLVRYMVQGQGKTTFPKTLWDNIKLKKETLVAIETAAGAPATDWWHDYTSALLSNELYRIPNSVLSPRLKVREFDTTSILPTDINEGPYTQLIMPDVEFLTSPLFSTLLDNQKLEPDMKISHCLTTIPGTNVEFSAFAHYGTSTPSEFIMAPLGATKPMNAGLKLDVPMEQAYLNEPGWRIVSLVSMLSESPGSENPLRMQIAVTRDRVWNGPENINVQNGGTIVIGTDEGFAAAFDVTYSLEGPGLARVKTTDYDNYGTLFQAWLLGETPADFTLNVSATQTVSSKREDYVGGYTIHTAGPIKTYRFEAFSDDVDGGQTELTYEDPAGSFQFTIGQDSLNWGGNLQAVYDITENRYDADDNLIESTPHPNQTTSLSSVWLPPYPWMVQTEER
ncbi:VCBS repeat-containing protein [bacterium]|nr:VCBS repeat-containing protein [bacterium]